MTTPTPPSRAYARLFALLLSVAAVLPALAAITGWKEVRAKYIHKDYVFYYPVVEKGRPVLTNEAGNPSIRLYKKASATSERARSHLYSLDGGKTFKLHLVTEEGPERDLAKSLAYTERAAPPAAPAPVPPAPAPAPAAVPEGVDADIWAEVQAKYAAGLSAEDQALVGKVLTYVKKNNADKLAAARAWLQKDPKANAAKVAQSAKAKGVPAAAGELLAWASAAPSGAGPAPAEPTAGGTPPLPGGQTAPPVGPGVPVGHDGGPLDQLVTGMKQEARWEEVAARIIPWAWKEREGGRSFFTPDARKNPNTKPAFEAALKVAVQDKDYWNSALHVYYVLGPGEPVPAWVLADPALKKLLVDDQARIKAAKLEEVLGQCLDRLQHNPTAKRPEKCDKQPDLTQVRSPYPGKDAAKWPRDFLNDAGREARILLQAITAGTVAISTGIANSPGTVGAVPGGSGPRQPRLPSMPTSEFGTAQLFGKWGDANVFSLDGRILAMVIRTNKKVEAGEPPRVVLTHQMGLYDISNAGDIYGKRFEITGGDQSFSLIPGGKTYNISLTPQGDDMTVSIKGGSGASPQMSNGSKSLPTLNEMYQNRARQALDSGNRVVIGARVYRVTGEATNTGNVLFWDEKDLLRQAGDIESDRPGGMARYWVPKMMAEVDEMRDGRTQNISDKASLGYKVNDQWQGLKWENGMWVPAQGEE
ncbi:hypothetical protein EPO15_05105, partial [bacterium]